MTPVFADYLQKNDIAGYMKALWKNANEGDIGSLHALLYLAVRCSEGQDILTFLDELTDREDPFSVYYSEEVFQTANSWPEKDQEDDDKIVAMMKTEYVQAQAHFPDHPDYEQIYGRNHNDILRAYLNGVGKNADDEAPSAVGVKANQNAEVPEDELDNWKRYYTRSDASSSLMTIYTGAIPYAKQGHPFAMFIVGYMLFNGIRTSYSSPSVVYLETNRKAALPWLEKAAVAGIHEAYQYIIEAYQSLAYHGPESEKAANLHKAEVWMNKGAEINDQSCIHKLFAQYKKEEQWEKAFPLLLRLADEFKSNECKLELAKWCAEGKGCEKDEKKAFEEVEYVYNHSSASPYSSDYDDSAEMLYEYLMNGIGCEEDVDRAISIRHKLKEDWDYLEDVLSR